MAENKTQENDASVEAFLDSVENKRRQADSRAVHEMMARVSGEPARMWGSAIVGFGRYHYKYDSGREGDYMLTGYSPRKQALTVYIMPGFSQYQDQMARLGKHKTGKSCLYINKVDDIDLDVLEEIIRLSLDYMREKYHT